MKFGVVNKLTTVNRFVLHTLQRNMTHLAVITRKTNIKLGSLKLEKNPSLPIKLFWKQFKNGNMYILQTIFIKIPNFFLSILTKIFSRPV